LALISPMMCLLSYNKYRLAPMNHGVLALGLGLGGQLNGLEDARGVMAQWVARAACPPVSPSVLAFDAGWVSWATTCMPVLVRARQHA